MQLQFLGATGTVTGSRYLVRSKQATVLIDCGLFQGYKQLRLRNWDPFPVSPAALDAVVLTHAHLDHSGFLPALIRDGFRGKVFCSEATYDLCKILLTDSAHLLEEEAEYANRRGFSKHHPAAPLYTQADAERALKQFAPVAFEREMDVGSGLRATLRRTGHILGAASVSLTDGSTRLAFSGDLGRPTDLIMEPPDPLTDTDYLVLESTYGNRLHDGRDTMQKLAEIIRETAGRGGVTIIPAFAVGRAQTILYMLHQLKQDKRIPATLPVFLNSPMAVDATEIYQRHMADHRLSPAICRAMYQSVHVVNSAEESIALNRRQIPMVIIAASGMATGGRVLHHLRAFGPDPRNSMANMFRCAPASNNLRTSPPTPIRLRSCHGSRISMHRPEKRLLLTVNPTQLTRYGVTLKRRCIGSASCQTTFNRFRFHKGAL
jgi:metallo-beta-lactamase family protein